MEIPSRLGKLLGATRNHGLAASVGNTLGDFDSWLRRNELVFFPEFTDHGPDHIYEVMASAASLISDTAWKKLNPEDAAALILATLVHDIGMHLRPDHFVSLIDPNRPDEPAPQFLRSCQDRPWSLLWDEYRREASRWDEKRIRQIFGTAVPIGEVIDHTVAALQTDSEMLHDRAKRLIGEFVRRHHPRIAHEVAVFGVLGSDQKRLRLNVDPEMADLTGLIARSHGMRLRKAVDLLPAAGRQTWRKVHAPFLMAILRIADYLQVHAERAPKKFLDVQRLRSPVSRSEWDAHEAVRDVHTEHPDPEAIVVEAAPKNGPTWLKLKRLLTDVQAEVDASWAVLGEVYGAARDPLGLTLRRIRSNLDDEQDFSESADFFPVEARFRTADGEVLKLLVGPLYEDRPEYGVRELIQNAVDAVIELEDYAARHPRAETDRPEQAADVVVTLHREGDGSGWLEVNDCGIGMTPETIRDYFLMAGASYRQSLFWQQEHMDEAGSRVARLGRFGIGVLAAYLLGSRITVSTRHVSSKVGVRFECGLEDNAINLKKCMRPVGTTVRVEMKEQQVKQLFKKGWQISVRNGQITEELGEQWDWWCVARPSVERRIEPDGIVLRQQYTVPSRAGASHEWRTAETGNSVELSWTYLASAPDLCCNGVQLKGMNLDGSAFIAYPALWGAKSALDGQLRIEIPSVSVRDPDGLFPLDLIRSHVVWDNPYIRHNLLESVCRDIIAYSLVNAPESGYGSGAFLREMEHLGYPGLERGDFPGQFMATPSGLVLNELSFLFEVRPGAMVLGSPDRFTSELILRSSGAMPSYVPLELRPSRKREPASDLRKRWNQVRALLYGRSTDDRGMPDVEMGAFGLVEPNARRVFVPTRTWERAVVERERVTGDGVVVEVGKAWTVLTNGGIRGAAHEIHGNSKHQRAVAAVWYFSPWESPGPKRSPLATIWHGVLGGTHIPYDRAERRERFASAYDELADYIEAHEELRRRRVASAEPRHDAS